MEIMLKICGSLSLPLIFLTLYTQTEKGTRLKLGSYFILRKFTSQLFKVRHYGDWLMILLRCGFAVLMAFMIIDPTDTDIPDRELMLHPSASGNGMALSVTGHPIEWVVPDEFLDQFEEDIYLLESLVKNLRSPQKKVTLLYAPAARVVEKIIREEIYPDRDLIILPGFDQTHYPYGAWASLFRLKPFSTEKIQIKNTRLALYRHYPIEIIDSQKVIPHALLADNTPLAITFARQDSRVLFFGAGPATVWGEMGISGFFIDLIDLFLRERSFANSAVSSLAPAVHKRVLVKTKLRFDLLVKAALILLLIEGVYFVGTPLRSRTFWFVFVLLLPLWPDARARCEAFKFIELVADESQGDAHKAVFGMLKQALATRTTIEVAADYYESYSMRALNAGKMPSFPYLWYLGCHLPEGFSKEEIAALKRFIQKGGIFFIDTCGPPEDYRLVNFWGELSDGITGTRIAPLSSKHALARSFYLLPPGLFNNNRFFGVSVSASTKRTGMLISRNHLADSLLRQNEASIRIGINTVLYMLCGNYKNDQIHVRHILKRIKKRGLYK